MVVCLLGMRSITHSCLPDIVWVQLSMATKSVTPHAVALLFCIMLYSDMYLVAFLCSVHDPSFRATWFRTHFNNYWCLFYVVSHVFLHAEYRSDGVTFLSVCLDNILNNFVFILSPFVRIQWLIAFLACDLDYNTFLLPWHCLGPAFHGDEGCDATLWSSIILQNALMTCI